VSDNVSIVTRKGQVTIPAEVRRSLGLKRGDRVAFVIEDSAVRIIPRGSVAQRTAGMFRTGKRPLTAEQLRKEAEAAIAAAASDR
jgi:AbrB family looped-hinge helix DNA binding protein